MDDNIMRHIYRALTDKEKGLVQQVKDDALDLAVTISDIGASRELSLAVTKVEEAVMWATKHITK